MSFNINQFLPQEICLKCDGCCRYSQDMSVWQPALLDTEVRLTSKDFRYKDAISYSNKISLLSYNDGFICSFFDIKINKCKIYDNRPFECRLYPFLINKTKDEIYLSVDLSCPFIKDRLKDKISKDYVDYLNNFLNLPDVSLVLRRNLHIFTDYAEANVKNLSILVF